MAVTGTHVLEVGEKAVEDPGVARALVAIGLKTGLFRALARAGSVTPSQLAARSGFSERFTGEWLAELARAGYVAEDGHGRYHCGTRTA